MNSTSREIRRLNITWFFNRRGLLRCYRCCLSCFLLFGQRASACTFDDLFVRLPSLCLEVCLSFGICLNISLPFMPFIQLLLFEQDTSVFYLNSHSSSESRSSFVCNQNIKEDISTELGFYFALKQNEMKRNINWSSTKTSTQRATKIRERTGHNI